MALIVLQHVVADQLPVDQDFAADIEAGQLVTVEVTGLVAAADVAGEVVYGIAGDTQSDTTAGTAYAEDLVMGADGALTRSTQNRVSDFYNETGASGMMTVYTGGGKFATDQWAAAREDNINPSDLLYADANGQLTDVAGAGNACGICTVGPSAYPSGVPGVDADNSISLGTYVTFKSLV